MKHIYSQADFEKLDGGFIPDYPDFIIVRGEDGNLHQVAFTDDLQFVIDGEIGDTCFNILFPSRAIVGQALQ